MRKIITRAIVAGFGLGLSAIAAFALVFPPSFAPRFFAEQQTHYIRFAVNFNSCTLPASAGNCSFKVGALPYNAFLVRGYYQVYTAFNSTTTDTVALYTSSGTAGTNLVAAVSTHTQAPGVALTIVAANLGTAALGNGIAQTGTNGGLDIWANIAYTGASPATTGSAVVILEYIAPNDGACPTVPQSATSPGC